MNTRVTFTSCIIYLFIYLWVRFRALLKFDGDFAPEFGTPCGHRVGDLLPIYVIPHPTYTYINKCICSCQLTANTFSIFFILLTNSN